MRPLLLLSLILGLSAAEGYSPQPATTNRMISGWTTPCATLDVAFEVAGRVTAVKVQEGQLTQGGTLAFLDPELADLGIAGATAALAQAEAMAQGAAQAWARAQREREQAAIDLARMESLRTTISPQEHDAARLSDTRATALLAEAIAAAEGARAGARAAEAALATAKAHRARHDLTLPAGWVVTRRIIHPGSLVAAGTPVLSLADVRSLILPLRCDEDEVAALRAMGDRIPVRFQQSTAIARLRRVDVSFDPLTRKRLVELELPGSDAPEASGGLTVQVAVQIPDPSGALAIPANLVTWELESPSVRLQDGTRQRLLVLRRDPDHVVIPAGSLPAGATLALP